jgi:squalene-hopene/tetraprenyl-beta-curcumene cyclase
MAMLFCATTFLHGSEPVTLENVVPPERNTALEPMANTFSMERAVFFLDSAALSWQKSRKCFTCHTNYAYLMARPSISAAAPAHQEVRRYAEELVSERWDSVGPRWDAEVVATAASLALNDAATTKKLHPLSRRALDRMWTVQRASGEWEWLTKCGWPPMESDEHYGVTLAAIATGAAPEDYAKTGQAQAGLAKIRAYLKSHPAPDLHHKAMVLWASTYVDGLLSDQERKTSVQELLAAERPQGGWALATLYPWKRADRKDQDYETSDGYGTGFVIYVLRRAGVSETESALVRGLGWLKSHQRASGRWFTRSLNKDNEHFISHAGTAFAVMAIAACGEHGG